MASDAPADVSVNTDANDTGINDTDLVSNALVSDTIVSDVAPIGDPAQKEATSIDCIICLEPLKEKEITFTPCIHGYHTVCINRWIEEKTRLRNLRIPCPTCKVDISSLIPYRDTEGLYDDDEHTVPLPDLDDVIAGRPARNNIRPLPIPESDSDIEPDPDDEYKDPRGHVDELETNDPELAHAIQRSLDVLSRPPVNFGDVQILPRGMQYEDFVDMRRRRRRVPEIPSVRDRRVIRPDADRPMRRPVGPDRLTQRPIANLFGERNPLDAVMERLMLNRLTSIITANPQSPAAVFGRGAPRDVTVHVGDRPARTPIQLRVAQAWNDRIQPEPSGRPDYFAQPEPPIQPEPEPPSHEVAAAIDNSVHSAVDRALVASEHTDEVGF